MAYTCSVIDYANTRSCSELEDRFWVDINKSCSTRDDRRPVLEFQTKEFYSLFKHMNILHSHYNFYYSVWSQSTPL